MISMEESTCTTPIAPSSRHRLEEVRNLVCGVDVRVGIAQEARADGHRPRHWLPGRHRWPIDCWQRVETASLCRWSYWGYDGGAERDQTVDLLSAIHGEACDSTERTHCPQPEALLRTPPGAVLAKVMAKSGQL